MIDAFYDRVEKDEELSPLFPDGVHEEHRRHVGTWWCEVFGGPASYTSDLGGYERPRGYERMVQKHVQLGITKEQRFGFVSLMSLAADDVCPRIRSFALPSLPTSSGERGSPSTTLKRTRSSSNMPPYLGGAGGKRPRTAPDRSWA